MACSQTLSGIVNDCLSNMGGVRKVYLANKEDVTAVTLTQGKVTAITMASSAKFKGYYLKPNTASMSSNWQVNQENGTNYVQTDLVMVFNRMDTAKRIEVVAMAQGELVALVEDANGSYWFLGYDAALVLSAGDGLTGTARADRNGYSVTLQDNSQELPHEILVGDGGVDLSAIVAA
jgi:hypothetical protein